MVQRPSEKSNNIRMLNGAQSRNRTSDTRIFNPLLYQLSYLGTVRSVASFGGGVIRQVWGAVQRDLAKSSDFSDLLEDRFRTHSRRRDRGCETLACGPAFPSQTGWNGLPR